MKQSLRSFLQRIPLAWGLLLLLSSRAQAQVPNDDCAAAVALTTSSVCTTPVNGTVAAATQSLAPTAACGLSLTTAADVWYSFTATSTTHLVTLAPRFAAVLDVRSGTCATSTSVFCTTIANNNTAAVPVGGLVSGQSYFIRIYPNSNTPPTGIGSTFALCIGQGATGPANDDCAGAINVPVSSSGTCTNTVNADNTLATSSAGVPAPTCANYQGRDLWFAVTVPASGNVTVQTVAAATGDVGDTGMSMYSGTCGNLVDLGCNDDGAGSFKSLLSFTGRTPGEVLYVRVWSFGNRVSGNIAVCATSPAAVANDNCAGAVALPVATACTPVTGTVAGAAQSLPPSANCGFATTANDVWYSFTASGTTQTLTFTGSFQAVAEVFSGACTAPTSVFCGTAFTGQGLTLTGLTSGQPYLLRLYPNTNTTVPPANAQFTLCLTPGPTPPANDNCAGAIALPVTTACTTPVAGTVAAASQSLPPSASCGFATTANDVWYSFTASGTSQTLTFTGSFQAVAEVFSGACASSTSVFCNTTFPNQSLALTGLTSGQTYLLRLYANSTVPPLPINSAFTLCLTAGPAPVVNDECSAAVAVAVVQSCATSTNGTVTNATQSLPPAANCNTTLTAADVWYSFVASGTTQLITLNTRFVAVLEVRSGTCATTTSLFCDNVFPNTTTGTLVGGLTTGQTYFIRIYASGPMPPIPANATFTLCVSPAPTPPANDECSGAVVVPVTTACTTPVSGTVEAASQSLPPTCGPATVAQDVWYSFVASGVSQLITLNARFGAALEVRGGTCAASTSVTCVTVPANSTAGNLVGGLTGGQTYFMRVYAASGIQPTPPNATFTLCVNPGPTPPANDDCAGALNVPVQSGTTCVSQVSADNTAATSSSGVPAPTCASYQGRDLWFKATVPANGALTIQTVAPTGGSPVNDTGLSVYSGTCGTLTDIGCNDDTNGLYSLLSYTGRTPGEVLYIRVWAFGGNAAGPIAVCVTSPTTCAAPTAPVATGVTATSAQVSWQPGGTPATGTTYTIEYGVQGFSPGSGTVISGLTTASAQLTSLQPGTAYCYYVRQNCPAGNGSSANVGPTCFTTPCATPTGLAATGLTAASAQLGWQVAGTPPSGTTYTVQYGLQGFALGTGNIISSITTPSFQLTGLQASTAYCFYVRQDCPGATGSGSYAGPVCFTTTAASGSCVSPVSPAAVATATTAQLTWQPGGTPAAGTTYTVQYGLQGFVLGTGISTSGIISPSYQLTGLLPGTAYCFYVRQDCPGTSGSSAFVGPICFQTLTSGSVPANDDPCGALTLALTPSGSPLQPLSGTNVGATTSTQPGIGAPTCAPTTAPADVWFALTPAAGVTAVTLTLTGAPAGLVRVFTAPACATGPFTLVACRSSGASNTSLGTITIPGLTPGTRYYLAVSGYGAADAPGAFTISGVVGTATRAQVDTNALLVYPNPSTTGQLTLKLGNAPARSATISLLNALGQVVRTAALPAGTTEYSIGTRDLATGLYTVRVVSGADVFTRKVTLE